MEVFLTTKEVLAIGKISRQTLDNYRKLHGFPEPDHWGGHPRGPCRYKASEVYAWFGGRRTPSPPRGPRAPDEGHPWPG
jgi:predicted DNA-binding transcriptional regulator AlpA